LREFWLQPGAYRIILRITFAFLTAGVGEKGVPDQATK
jgi:hypothetical protein